jgi:hypothetical protein
MKKSNRVARAIAAGVLSAAMVGLPASVWGADSTAPAPSNSRTEFQQQVKDMREKMLNESKANDAELEKMIAELNQAPESKKTDLEAAILTKMVDQQHQTLTNWENLRAQMQQARPEHMPTGR